MADAGDINGAEVSLDQLITRTLTAWRWPPFYMYLNQMKDDTLFEANYSREECGRYQQCVRNMAFLVLSILWILPWCKFTSCQTDVEHVHLAL
ncbi:DUF6483 family protein [Enterocloster sp.]|uniref:DUF6483 family protein n=1 Tax=Enterocloster sp. TaxID=2719315 RepID=UPI00399F5070